MTKIINFLIRKFKLNVSDGYHTFEELYEHRCMLWAVMARQNSADFWKSKTHFDGSVWEGWFVLGKYKSAGKQITYHLPMKYWELLKGVTTLPKAHRFDGHTSEDVLERLINEL